MVLHLVLLIDPLQVLGKHTHALFQNLVIKSHLLLASDFFVRLITTEGSARSRLGCPVGAAVPLARRSRGSRTRGAAIATPIVLSAELQHVLVHELLGLLDVCSLSVDTSHQTLRNILDEL